MSHSGTVRTFCSQSPAGGPRHSQGASKAKGFHRRSYSFGWPGSLELGGYRRPAASRGPAAVFQGRPLVWSSRKRGWSAHCAEHAYPSERN